VQIVRCERISYVVTMADWKWDSFSYALVGGLLILAVLLLVVGTGSSGGGYATANSWPVPATQPELITADLGSARETGMAITDMQSNINLGRFDVSGVVEEQTMPSGVVQSGVLFGDNELKFSVTNPEYLRFTVSRMNDYGTLVVKVNGRVLQESRPGVGEHTVPLSMYGDVTIELVAASSGWKMWAPNLYDITNVVVGTVHPVTDYSFARGEDFLFGELYLTSERGTGVMNVNLNDELLWSGMLGAGNWKVVSFDRVKDVNKLTVEALQNSFFVGNAKLVLYYEHLTAEPYVTTFNLTSEQLGKLPGHITFEIPSVVVGGTVVVELKAGDQTKLSESVDAVAGAHAVAFFKNNIVPGEAMQLVIKSSDALFALRNVKVWA